ncbi:MAG: M20/M25/M40 family metallo-hydrolase [Candidatus Pacebacteria bacterium]|nr:M20/M25/M40 family metallo-hydrolase [Candidatus Paceibacterota bacterium]
MKAPHFFSQYQTLLAEFISFKSISTDPAYNEACRDTALWLEALLQKNGCTTELWQGKKTHPVVYASYTVDKDAPTVLIYGHYDVQPADRADGWSSDPFTLTIKNKRMIARGAVDNKGQIMTHIASVCHAIQNNDLGVNVIFLIEGNEESGNDELPVLLKKHKKKLRADLILVSDGETSDDRPTIDMTFRGGGNIRVVYTTAANAFHSGIYGGAVPSATQSLASMLATLKDTRTNMVAVKNFYTSAITPTRAHKKKSPRARFSPRAR